MCVCVKARSPEPERLQRNSHEPDDDLEILVGPDPCWRFSARRDVLAAASPVFEAQFHGPLATREPTLHLPDIDPRAFEVLLRYVNGHSIKFASVTTALCTFCAAHKYLISGLIQVCAEFLNQSLQVDTVLEVFQLARQYSYIGKSPKGSHQNLQPSAPPEDDELPDPEPPGVTGWSAVLLSQCLDFIDTHGEAVLAQEALEDLQPDAIRDILGRDTLQCNEISVLAAIERWADRECRKNSLAPVPSNRRKVLADLLYLVRFPQLSAEEFVRGPIQSEILTPEELKYFSALLSRSEPCKTPDSVVSYIADMKRPRRLKVVPSSSSVSQPTLEKKKSKGWLRSKNSKAEKTDKTEKSRRCSGSCIAEGLLDAWVFLFD